MNGLSKNLRVLENAFKKLKLDRQSCLSVVFEIAFATVMGRLRNDMPSTIYVRATSVLVTDQCISFSFDPISPRMPIKWFDPLSNSEEPSRTTPITITGLSFDQYGHWRLIGLFEDGSWLEDVFCTNVDNLSVTIDRRY